MPLYAYVLSGDAHCGGNDGGWNDAGFDGVISSCEKCFPFFPYAVDAVFRLSFRFLPFRKLTGRASAQEGAGLSRQVQEMGMVREREPGPKA